MSIPKVDDLEAAKERNRKNAAEILQLRAELAWYADPKNWETYRQRKSGGLATPLVSPATLDGGQRAREALGKAPSERFDTPEDLREHLTKQGNTICPECDGINGLHEVGCGRAGER